MRLLKVSKHNFTRLSLITFFVASTCAAGVEEHS